MSLPEDHLFTWLHLSDIHMGHGAAVNRWDQKLVLQALLLDVKQVFQATDRRTLDAILVTGDIAYSGGVRSCAEYPDAAMFLSSIATTVGLDTTAVFVIPGNHDVQRTADQNRSVRRLVHRLRAGDEALDDVLANEEDRAWLATRQANFWAFARKFAPLCLEAEASDVRSSQLWWSHRTKGRGINVRFIGLNTALIASDESDFGRLQLGLSALGDSLLRPVLEPNELVVALSHHPLRGGWLADEKECNAWLCSRAHVHLFGHLHEPDTEEARTGAGGHFVRVSAGATHGDDASPGTPSGHGYNVAAVVRMSDNGFGLRIWPRRWSDRHKAFRADMDNLPDGQSSALFKLRFNPELANVPLYGGIDLRSGVHVTPPISHHAEATAVGSERKVPTSNSLRRLLGIVLTSDSDLNAFSLDFFSDIYALFSEAMNRTQKHTLLLERADRAEVLLRLRQAHPAKVRGQEGCIEYEVPHE